MPIYNNKLIIMKILLVEDNLELQELVAQSLTQELFVVERASSMREAKARLDLYAYDCLLLDLNLPDGEGLNLLKYLREEGREEPVLILSARGSVEDRVEGLALGADDYLPKPFHTSELIARIRSIIRRRWHSGSKQIHIGNISITPDERLVSIAGKPLELTRKEYDILYYCSLRVGRLLDKQALAESVWGDHIDQVDNFDFIYAQIKNLRKKLKEAGAEVEIKAVYGIGYKFVVL